jgi:hypothetical protein
VAVANQKNILFYLKILSVHNCQVQVRKKRDKIFEYIDLIIRDVKIKKVHASKNKSPDRSGLFISSKTLSTRFQISSLMG